MRYDEFWCNLVPFLSYWLFVLLVTRLRWIRILRHSAHDSTPVADAFPPPSTHRMLIVVVIDKSRANAVYNASPYTGVCWKTSLNQSLITTSALFSAGVVKNCAPYFMPTGPCMNSLLWLLWWLTYGANPRAKFFHFLLRLSRHTCTHMLLLHEIILSDVEIWLCQVVESTDVRWSWRRFFFSCFPLSLCAWDDAIHSVSPTWEVLYQLWQYHLIDKTSSIVLRNSIVHRPIHTMFFNKRYACKKVTNSTEWGLMCLTGHASRYNLTRQTITDCLRVQ